MTKDELKKYCRYYKGEKECPYEHRSAKGRFWYFEKMYLDRWANSNKSWERYAISYMKNYPDAQNLLTQKDVSIHTKGIAMFINEMYGKWMPYSMDEVLEY
ncbi:MAG: hypothetical protein LUD48_02485 [Prevotella sp.]|nr:hypothetical protein [Prevotella sp.]